MCLDGHGPKFAIVVSRLFFFFPLPFFVLLRFRGDGSGGWGEGCEV